MYPVGLKDVVVSLVEGWEKLVTENARLGKSKPATDKELFAALPKWAVRSLRELLGLVIASYDYTVFYEEMLLSAHEKCGTRKHPYWCSEEWEVDFVSLITKGVDSLGDKDILLLALHPAGVTMAHEIVGEEIMYGDRIAGKWHVLVDQVYKERRRQVLKAAAELEKALQGDRQAVVAEKPDVVQVKTKVVSDLSWKKCLLGMVSGETIDVDDAEEFSNTGGDEKISGICIHCGEAQLPRQVCFGTCSRCEETWLPGQERCWLCGYCADESDYIEDLSDDAEDMDDNRASLSDLSLEKLDVRKILELENGKKKEKKEEMPLVMS